MRGQILIRDPARRQRQKTGKCGIIKRGHCMDESGVWITTIDDQHRACRPAGLDG
jgi:hypothetical protein